MSASMERSLGARERLKLRLHLFACTWCARYLNQIRFLREVIRKRASDISLDQSSPASLHAAARERIKESLQREINSHHSPQ